MKKNINIAIVGLGQIGNYLYNEINIKKKDIEKKTGKKVKIVAISAKNRNKKSSDLRNIGAHPETGEDLVVKDGRYGPYISDGKVNVALKGDLTQENITLEQAVDLINQKRKSPTKKRKKRKKKK